MKNALRNLAVLALAAALPAGAAAAGDWIALFDGQTLEGWTPNESPGSWAIEDGAVVTRGDRSHLFYTGPVANHDFKNFEFSVDVMTEPGANSGIYVHTKFQPDGWPAAGYECQVINSSAPPRAAGAYVERKMSGSIYAIRNAWKSPARDGEWFEYRILVEGKTISTYIDGLLVCSYTERDDPFRPSDKTGRLLSSGTFAFQAHDPGSVVRYRAMRVRILPENTPSSGAPLADAELDELVTQLSNDNAALIDFGIAAPSSSFAKTLLNDARRYGVTLGIQQAKTKPERALSAAVAFHGWSAGPQPWKSKKPAPAPGSFDYLTAPYSLANDGASLVPFGAFVEARGIDLVEVEIPENVGAKERTAFEALLKEIAARGAALLANDRSGAPSAELLRQAKAAGVKVAFGSGGDRGVEAERLKRRLQAIRAAGLSWADLWVPGSE